MALDRKHDAYNLPVSWVVRGIYLVGFANYASDSLHFTPFSITPLSYSAALILTQHTLKLLDDLINGHLKS